MIHLITGGSASGKSAYAEDWLLGAEGEARKSAANDYASKDIYLYVATMIPYGRETKEKILRHRRLREGKGFVTLECPRNLAGANIPGNRGVLLECVSNLAANELYGQDGRIKDVKETREAILKGIRHLAEYTDRLAIVTNEVNCDVNDYSKETEEYRMLMGQVNQKIADMADMVTEVVYGIPVEIKRS